MRPVSISLVVCCSADRCRERPLEAFLQLIVRILVRLLGLLGRNGVLVDRRGVALLTHGILRRVQPPTFGSSSSSNGPLETLTSKRPKHDGGEGRVREAIWNQPAIAVIKVS
jgi:hypothetical protein